MEDERGRRGREGERLQREVLALVLVEHPLRLKLREVQAELGRAPEIETAVAALVAAGLLALEDEKIVPTAAAIRFNEIEPIDPPS